MDTVFCVIGMFTAALILTALIQTYLFQMVRVKGGSMKNTLQSGEIVLAVKRGAYRRGDVVLCHYPRQSQWSATVAGFLNVTGKTPAEATKPPTVRAEFTMLPSTVRLLKELA